MTLAACTTPTTTAGLSENSLSGGTPRQNVVAPAAASKSPITDVIGASPTPGASTAPNGTASAAATGASPAASGDPAASPSPSVSPTPPEGIAATATPTTTGLAVTARESADRPAALVNYDSGEIIWVPGEPQLKWTVKARTAITFKKIELRLGAEASAVYRVAQAEESASPSPSPSVAPSVEPSPVPSTAATLDTSFIPSPEPSPSPSPSPAVGGKPGLSQTHEIPLAALGAPDSLPPGSGLDLKFYANAAVVESYVRTVKPLNLVYVSLALFDAEGKPVLDGDVPVVLTGQFLVK